MRVRAYCSPAHHRRDEASAGGRVGVICAPNGRGAADDGGVVSLTTPRGRRAPHHRRHIITTTTTTRSFSLSSRFFSFFFGGFLFFFFFFLMRFFNTLRARPCIIVVHTQCVAPPTHFRFIAAAVIVINATTPLCSCSLQPADVDNENRVCPYYRRRHSKSVVSAGKTCRAVRIANDSRLRAAVPQVNRTFILCNIVYKPFIRDSNIV